MYTMIFLNCDFKRYVNDVVILGVTNKYSHILCVMEEQNETREIAV